MKKLLFTLLKMLVFLLVLFATMRVVFLVKYWTLVKLGEISTAEILKGFWSALPLDISTACFILALPVIYMFDRCDFVVGQESPMTKAAYRLGAWQFFAQIEPTTSSTVKGTGILTRYIISDFDGIGTEGVYMSGCVQPVPMKTTTAVCMYTARIDSVDDIQTIADLKSQDLLGESVVVATVANKVKADVVKYIENNMSLRACVYGSEDTELDVLVIVPMSYVCRSIEKSAAVNLPYYRVSIEKWLW